MTVHRDAIAEVATKRSPDKSDAIVGKRGLQLLLGESQPMQRLYRLMQEYAAAEGCLFLSGESGSGKELVARAIHELGPRSNNDFVPLNCGTLSPERLESELFGNDHGHFSGTNQTHPRYMQRASTGTLFLDEIAEMNAGLQSRLLEVLESGGTGHGDGRKRVAVDTRIIAATRLEPEDALRGGRLREDLYRRLSQTSIRVPPMRERGEDITRLAHHFLQERNAETRTEKRFSEDVLQAMQQYEWPGNVRELKNTVRHAHLLADAVIKREDLPGKVSSAGSGNGNFIRVNVGTPLSEVERRTILATLEHFHGDKKKAAFSLRISLKTLYNRLKQYDHRQ